MKLMSKASARPPIEDYTLAIPSAVTSLGDRCPSAIPGDGKDERYVVCRHCDAVQRQISLGRHEVAACATCGCIVSRHQLLSIDQLLALTAAAAALFLIANLYPLMTVEVDGMHTQATVLGAVLRMLQGWETWPGIMLAFCMFILPMIQITVLLWILAFASFGRQAPGLRGLLVALHRARPWSMSEVFLLGALVTIVKLSSWVEITPGIGVWALAGLTVLLAILSTAEPGFWWSLLQVHR